jgi:hypothetical protein
MYDVLALFGEERSAKSSAIGTASSRTAERPIRDHSQIGLYCGELELIGPRL